ncbi:MAG: MBL fold metallo-hydrolase, partial [Pseudomonadota bacterium]
MSAFGLIGAAALASTTPISKAPLCERELVVLGAGQDAGAPQIGNTGDQGEPLSPSSVALVDRKHGTRYLFDATPAITFQLWALSLFEPAKQGLGIDGIFLTHAHMGHYLGLAYLGVEAANADKVPVFAMPRMAAFLRENGPWSQLVEKENIVISELADDTFTVLTDDFGVLPIRVPHRDEYSETVGFLIMTPDKRAIYMPDLDSWDELAEMGNDTLESLIAGADFLFLDATFWD